MPMGWHIWTRSRNRDYRFIGGAPNRWWSRFTTDSSFERPTLLLESRRNGEWRLLVSGIPSTRKDRHNTLIRYTIVGEGPAGHEVDQVQRLVSAWLDEAATIFAADNANPDKTTTGEPLSSILNRHFSEDTIEEWFAKDPSRAELCKSAQERLLSSINELDLPPVLLPENGEPSSGWYGSLHAQQCREAFLRQSYALLDGRDKGAVYLLNLAESPEQLSADFERRTCVVLFDIPPESVAQPTNFHQRPTSAAKKKDASRREADGTPLPAPTSASDSAAQALDRDSSALDTSGAGHSNVAHDQIDELAPDHEGGDSSILRPKTPDTNPSLDGDGDHERLHDLANDPYTPSAILRALSGSDVVKKVRDASRGIEDVLGVSRDVLEDRLGLRSGSLEEVLGGSKEALEDVLGVSKEVLEERLGIKTGTLDEVLEEKLGVGRGKSLEEALGVSKEALEERLGIRRENLEEVLGLSREALEEKLGAGLHTAGKHTLDVLKVLSAAARDGAGGASQSARELLETVKALSARIDVEHVEKAPKETPLPGKKHEETDLSKEEREPEPSEDVPASSTPESQ